MADLLTDEIRSWIGRSDPPQRIEVTRRDIIKYSVSTEQRLDKYRAGDEAPPMFLFGAHAPIAALDELGPDGRRVDSLVPELPLKRVMAGGIKQEHHRALRPGDVVTLTRTLTDIFAKQGKTGPLIFVVFEIEARLEAGELVYRETQTRIMR